jgi:hypothetical protein
MNGFEYEHEYLQGRTDSLYDNFDLTEFNKI